MISKFRPYQSELVRDIYEAWGRVRNVLAVCATGSGKTVMAAGVLSQERVASVFIAHRSELVSQASLALAREGVRHKIIGSASSQRTCAAIHLEELRVSYVQPTSRVAVAGVDTLVRMDKADPWFSQVSIWICDEAAHLLRENKWGRATAMFPNARGLGFTATPVRSDGKGLGRHADGVFDELVEGPPMHWLISSGFLTPYRLFCPPSNLDLSAVPISAGGDFSPERLRKAVHSSRLVGDVVSHYVRGALGKLGMTFCVDVETATKTAQEFRNAGVSAAVIHGGTQDIVRARTMRDFRARKILQLVSVDILGEGVDVPAVEVVSLARPTQSLSLHMQQVGRGLRLLDGKSHALIFDHAGNSLRHGLVDSAREWSLDRRERRSRSVPLDTIPLRSCLNPQCAGVYERVLSACPYCGFVAVPSGRSAPEQVDGDLLELDASVLAQMRGEIAHVDGDPVLPFGAAADVQGAVRKRHHERQVAQRTLRAALALWGGWQRALGRLDPEAYKRFYFKFGTDIASAMALGAREADELCARVTADLQRNNITEKTQ